MLALHVGNGSGYCTSWSYNTLNKTLIDQNAINTLLTKVVVRAYGFLGGNVSNYELFPWKLLFYYHVENGLLSHFHSSVGWVLTVYQALRYARKFQQLPRHTVPFNDLSPNRKSNNNNQPKTIQCYIVRCEDSTYVGYPISGSTSC